MLKQLSEEAYRARAASGGSVPVYREYLADMETPVSVLSRVGEEDAFLLESVAGGTGARYSYLGVEPRATVFVEDGTVMEYDFDPGKVFTNYFPLDAIRGGAPEVNAALTRAVLKGRERSAYRFASVLNAAAAIVVGGRAATLEEGIRLASDPIDSGRAFEGLERMVA